MPNFAYSQAVPPRLAHTIDRRWQAVTLRARGLTYERIGEHLGCSKNNARELVIAAVEERRKELSETVDHVRAFEVERLDTLTRKMFERLDDKKNDDPEKTVIAILRISERRASLLGLDAPKDFRITPGNVSPMGSDAGVDLSKLSTEELRQLEAMQDDYDRLVAKARIALPPGEPVAITEAPTQGEPCSPLLSPSLSVDSSPDSDSGPRSA